MIDWSENPLVRRELLYRLRPQPSQRAVVTVVVALVLVAVALLYWSALSSSMDYRDLLQATLVIEVVLVCAGAPAATANAVSREREQRTWDLLVITLLKPHEVVLGKLIGRVLPLAAIILLGLPVLVICVIGEPRLWVGALLGTLTVLATLLLYSVAGLAASCFSRKTVTATAISYLFVGGWVFGTLILWGLTDLLVFWYGADPGSLWLTLNPFAVITITLAKYARQGTAVPSPDLSQLFSPWALLAVYTTLAVVLLWRLISGYRRWAFR